MVSNDCASPYRTECMSGSIDSVGTASVHAVGFGEQQLKHKLTDLDIVGGCDEPLLKESRVFLSSHTQYPRTVPSDSERLVKCCFFVSYVQQ